MNKLDLEQIAKAVDEMLKAIGLHYMTEEEAEIKLKKLERNSRTEKTESELLKENKELKEECASKQRQIYKLSSDNLSYRVANEWYRNHLEDCEQKNEYLCRKREELEKKISELESDLSVKENIMKIDDSLRREKENNHKNIADFLPADPLGVADMLISAKRSYECDARQKELTGMDMAYYHIFDVSELRQVAEYLLVYCNHNQEE